MQLKMHLLTNIIIEPVTFEKRNPLDLVIFCGSPGAGKSTFYWKYLQPLGYERVNQDNLKSVSADSPSRPWLQSQLLTYNYLKMAIWSAK